MKIEKSSSTYLILDSGTAMTFDNQATLQLKLVLDQSFYFTVQILFKKGDGGERELMQSVDTETNTISLSCKNFDNALGTGTHRPIELATYQNKKIFLHFWVYALGENSIRKIDYCFYQER